MRVQCVHCDLAFEVDSMADANFCARCGRPFERGEVKPRPTDPRSRALAASLSRADEARTIEAEQLTAHQTTAEPPDEDEFSEQTMIDRPLAERMRKVLTEERVDVDLEEAREAPTVIGGRQVAAQVAALSLGGAPPVEHDTDQIAAAPTPRRAPRDTARQQVMAGEVSVVDVDATVQVGAMSDADADALDAPSDASATGPTAPAATPPTLPVTGPVPAPLAADDPVRSAPTVLGEIEPRVPLSALPPDLAREVSAEERTVSRLAGVGAPMITDDEATAIRLRPVTPKPAAPTLAPPGSRPWSARPGAASDDDVDEDEATAVKDAEEEITTVPEEDEATQVPEELSLFDDSTVGMPGTPLDALAAAAPGNGDDDGPGR